MQIGMIGLGRMGANMVRRLQHGGHQCVVFDKNQDNVKGLVKEGATGAASIQDFVAKLKDRRQEGSRLMAASRSDATEVMVELKPPPQRLFADSTPAAGESNYLRFRLSPDPAIALAARVKLAGKEFVGEQRELYLFEEQLGEESPYERLLGDAMMGDGALFTREDSVEAAWAVVDPVLTKHHRVRPYRRHSWGQKRLTRSSLQMAPGTIPSPRKHPRKEHRMMRPKGIVTLFSDGGTRLTRAQLLWKPHSFSH